MKHWSIIALKKWFLWGRDWNRKQWCFVDNTMEALVPSWVVYLHESWLVLMIYRPWLQCELSRASQIWQMAWQVTNTAGNLLAWWAEANTSRSQTSLCSLQFNRVKKDARKKKKISWSWLKNCVTEVFLKWWSCNSSVQWRPATWPQHHSSSFPPSSCQLVTFSVLPHDSRQLGCNRLHLLCCDPAPS